MKQLFSISIFLISILAQAQHTFSIVAVDTITGEVGGAAATCYAVVNDVADVHPGLGFIHTQSYVDYDNQAYAHRLMERGFSPSEIMDSLVAYDISGQPQLRQYAAVMFDNGPKSAAYTGTSCYTYRGHRIGRNYAIAGNILKGPMVLDSMEARFNRTQGTLAEKLMASLQGAKIVGADKRCLNKGVSSLSAYMIVAQPSDTGSSYYLNLNVENVLPKDPIDTLQSLFDSWKLTTANKKHSENINSLHTVSLSPNPVNGGMLNIRANDQIERIEFCSTMGTVNYVFYPHQKFIELNVSEVTSGIYFLRIVDKIGNTIIKTLIIK